MRDYDYVPGQMRAKCLRVVDGDTYDLQVDCGFHTYRVDRFRLFGYDTHELKDSDPTKRLLATQAKIFVTGMLLPGSDRWTCRVATHKDPDNFGRWLAMIYMRPDETETEVSLGVALLELGLAYFRP
jgi:endonuclease YncB( thermonuclease family)